MKNASEYWSDAMAEFDFEFFRNLYEDLQSPVLDNENSDCQFLSWDFNFKSVQVSKISSFFCPSYVLNNRQIKKK